MHPQERIDQMAARILYLESEVARLEKALRNAQMSDVCGRRNTMLMMQVLDAWLAFQGNAAQGQYAYALALFLDQIARIMQEYET